MLPIALKLAEPVSQEFADVIAGGRGPMSVGFQKMRTSDTNQC